MRRRDFCLSLPVAAGVPLLHGADLPRPCPDITFNLASGRKLSLSSFRGKVLAVEFILTTCSHCQRASRSSEMVYRQLGPKGFQPVGIAINVGANVGSYARDLQLSFPIGWVRQEDALSFLQLSVTSRMMMPQICFVDKTFAIRHQYSGDHPFFGDAEEKNIYSLVDGLLTEGTTPKKAVPAAKKKS